METQLLIDAIVRQTTVLIARLSTAEGVRSPLGHVANEVFTGLVDELTNQGVNKKVIADMFGMALRSYRDKVRRLGESATSRGVTLWSAVQAYLTESGPATRGQVLERFRFDDPVSVQGILNDLTRSGFVVRSGRGEETQYRVATEEELHDLGAALGDETEESLTTLVWLQIYREGPVTKRRLAQLVPVAEERIDAALERLEQGGRITCTPLRPEKVYEAAQLLIPVGESAGWEAAVIDHHRQVLNAIAAKISSGNRASAKQDEIGGTTLSFSLWPGHPQEKAVRNILAETRAKLLPLWDEVVANNGGLRPADEYQVHFYFGQYVVEEDDLG